MKKSIFNYLQSKYVFTLVLSLLGYFAYSQCTPQVTLTDGTKATSGTFCEGQLIAFTANSPGYTSTVKWDFGLTPAGTATSVDVNPTYGYAKAGNYTVTFEGTGPAGTCTATMDILVRSSPTVIIEHLNDSAQCFRENNFCFIDSSIAPNGLITRQSYVFSNGLRIDSFNNPKFPFEFCANITDPTGGYFDLVVESEDTSGCVRNVVYKDFIYVHPKIGPEFLNLTPRPNPGCDSTLGIFQNTTTLALSEVDSFYWNFGDGTIIGGNSTTDTVWWTGVNNDNKVEHMYNKNGTFDGTFVVSAYGCIDSFVWKAAVGNIVMDPKIISRPNPACFDQNPIQFEVVGLTTAPSAFLWNFGDPPAGLLNFNNRQLEPEYSYGSGPWMASLRLIVGPCDITIYDTIQIIGPASVIGLPPPANRVSERETYQCIIRDSVHFENNSTFYQSDFNRLDEDSITYYYKYTFDRQFDPTTGFHTFWFRKWEENKRGNHIVRSDSFGVNDTVFRVGHTVYYDVNKDSLVAIDGLDTSWHKTPWGNFAENSRFGLYPYKRFVFNYTPPVGKGGVGTGDQTAIPPVIVEKGMNPNVWRVWDLGDRFAPQCTTDTRPWVNKNIGINCNWTIDSLPVHWYTPWEEIYRTFQDGRNYTRPYTETRLFKQDHSCYPVSVYPEDTMATPKHVILTVPLSDSAYKYYYNFVGPGNKPNDSIMVTINDFGVHNFYVSNDKNSPNGGKWFGKSTTKYEQVDADTAFLDTDGNAVTTYFEPFLLTIRRPKVVFHGTEVYLDMARDTFVAVNDLIDTTLHNADWIGRDNKVNGNGTTTWTVTDFDMKFNIPTGVTITTLKLPAPGGGGAGVGNTRTITGPGVVTIEANEQFVVYSKDSIYPVSSFEVVDADTSIAQASTYYVLEEVNGVITKVAKSAVFVNSAKHREEWMLENAVCYNAVLWQKDTIHPLMCESEATKALALSVPSSKGLTFRGTTCPYDGSNDNYQLTFTLEDTKPNCSQRWFAINFDSLRDPANFIPFTDLTVPPKPGQPFPPYLPAGNYGQRIVKGYGPGEIGSDPTKRPNGSFTVGLIVGNGFGEMGNASPAECLDTTWYSDFLRILYVNAGFNIITPIGVKKHICAGGDAYFKIDVPIQDSIKELVWKWGYQTNALGEPTGRGYTNALYVEEYTYYAKYEGPSGTRNDSNIVWNNEDWLYNYIVRYNEDNVLGLRTIDTIVTSIMKDWKIVANKDGADEIIEAEFEAIGLDYQDVPAEDVAYYLGNSPSNCIDTTGFGQYFSFGIGAYSPKFDSDVWEEEGKRMRCTLYSPLFVYDTTNTFKTIIVKDTTFALDINGNRIKSTINPALDSFTTITDVPKNVPVQQIDSTFNRNRDDCISSYEVAHILHFRDSSIRGFDTLAFDTDFDGKVDTVLRDVWKHTYEYAEIVNSDPCDPKSRDTIYRKANGPMNPQLSLTNTVGCIDDHNVYINVGFYNDFWIEDESICEGLVLVVEDSTRYYQNGVEDFRTYPIHKTDYWHDFDRITDRLEYYEVDWDSTDGIWDGTSTALINHAYDSLGEYVVTIVPKDSTNCRDTSYINVLISDVFPGFEALTKVINCESIVDFRDTSGLYDPCSKRGCGDDNDTCESIIAWLWDFGDGTRTSILENPSHNYTSNGYFDVKLIVLTELGCVDSITQTIYIPGPQPEFEFQNVDWNITDTAIICVNDSIFLKNIGKGDINTPWFSMSWGDGNFSTPTGIDSFYGHAYDSVGIFELNITQEDGAPGSIRCSRIYPDTNPDLLIQHKIIVIVNPRPKVKLTASDTIVCPDEVITFTGTFDTNYIRLSWMMGDPANSEINRSDTSENTIDFSYATSGVYNVVFAPKYDKLPRCPATDTVQITVIDVTAGFTIDSAAAPEYCFTNTSTGAISYEWSVEDEPSVTNPYTTDTNFCYNWDQRVGEWEVCLIATSSEGCKDTVCQVINNRFRSFITPYNVFTPNADGNGDGQNDEFVIDGESIEEYSIKIYNRWGERVFESTDITYSWNGKVNNTGADCPGGTYFYIIDYKLIFGIENDGKGPIEGQVELIRGN